MSVCIWGCVKVCVCVCVLIKRVRKKGPAREGEISRCPSARIYWWGSKGSLISPQTFPPQLAPLSLLSFINCHRSILWTGFVSTYTLWRRRELKFWPISKRNYVLYSNCRGKRQISTAFSCSSFQVETDGETSAVPLQQARLYDYKAKISDNDDLYQHGAKDKQHLDRKWVKMC